MIELIRRYPDSKPEDITDAYNRGVLYGMSMGRGTCEVEIGTGQQRGWWVCKSCGDLFDSGSALACKKKQKPRYCPNCGKRVVDDASVD